MSAPRFQRGPGGRTLRTMDVASVHTLAAGLALTLSACGGMAVVEADSGGGGAPSAASSSISASGTGGGGCASHAECPGGLCVFSTGECATACAASACDSCGPGSICVPCATASCPGCADCLAACVPLPDGRCDDDDVCPLGSTCVFSSGYCAPICKPDLKCPDSHHCDPCATSDCCACDHCESACIGSN